MLLQFVINGLITGLLYSLLAIGVALVYNTTHIFYIAAAGIYVFTAYILWWLIAKWDRPMFTDHAYGSNRQPVCTQKKAP